MPFSVRCRLFRQAPPTAVQRIFRLQILRLPRFKVRVPLNQCRVTVWGPQVLSQTPLPWNLRAPNFSPARLAVGQGFVRSACAQTLVCGALSRCNQCEVQRLRAPCQCPMLVWGPQVLSQDPPPCNLRAPSYVWAPMCRSVRLLQVALPHSLQALVMLQLPCWLSAGFLPKFQNLLVCQGMRGLP